MPSSAHATIEFKVYKAREEEQDGERRKRRRRSTASTYASNASEERPLKPLESRMVKYTLFGQDGLFESVADLLDLQ